MSHRTPEPEVHISEELVHRLLRAQHPDLASLPVRRLDTGWDNTLFRLGDRLMARMPHRQVAVTNLEREQRWLEHLAPMLPLPVPTPVRIGVPGEGYPWPWSVVPWFAGSPADASPPDPGQARVLARFLRALHRPPPADAPRNPTRGVPLSVRRQAVESRLQILHDLPSQEVVVPLAVHRAWAQALAAPGSEADRWLHGDLHARNIVVTHGLLSAVIDWGDVCAGDPAVDLASFWMLFDDPAVRRVGLADYGADEALLARARGWVVFYAAMLGTLADDPLHQRTGRTLLRRLSED